jgi:hypothetical protein
MQGSECCVVLLLVARIHSYHKYGTLTLHWNLAKSAGRLNSNQGSEL